MPQPVGPVVYSIFVNEVLSKEFPLDVELRQTWGQHDIFYIRIEYQRRILLNTKVLWADNAPVRIIWGQAPNNTQIWYGYVNHHTINANSDSGSQAMQITYTCIGTSKPMNSDQTKTWGEVTGTYIAKTLAKKYGFRSVLSTTNWILPYEVQSNESDFHFLNRIADKVGYRFWISGGTLYFIDPIVVLRGSNNQAVPKYYMDKSHLYKDTIREFDMSLGDNLPGSAKTVRTMYGIDQTSGQMFMVKAKNVPGNPTVSQITSEWHATSIQEAQNLVDAWQGRSQFWLAASAELYGTSYLYPGKLVWLSGNQLNNEAWGYWIVAEANHVMKTSGTSNPTFDKYVTHCQLIRNVANTIPNLKAVQQISPEFTTCRLNGNLWQSTNQSVLYDNGP